MIKYDYYIFKDNYIHTFQYYMNVFPSLEGS